MSAERIRALSEDLRGVQWDLVMLESGQVTATGRWRYVGQVAATCDYVHASTNGTACTWQGSRGYLLGYEGAQMLLKHATPIAVQVDGLMGLVATFEPRFQMYWPRVNIVHKDFTRMSTIWDACVKCYLPTSGLYYAAVVVVLAAAATRLVVLLLLFHARKAPPALSF